METERIGPLSYSLDAPDGDFSAERPIIVGTLVALLTTLPALALGWLVLGVVGARTLVVLLSAIAGPLLGVGIAYATSRGRRRRQRNAVVAVGAAGLFVALLSYNLLGIARPAIPELRAAIDDVRLPAGFTEVSESTNGARFCRPTCPTVTRVYLGPETMDDPGRELLRAMFRQGWEPADRNVPPDSNTAAVRGRVLVDVYSTTGESRVRVVVTNSAGRYGAGG